MTGAMRVALVTGGSRGIGRATVAGLAALGHTVVLGARDPATTPPTGDVHVVRLDVTDPASVAAAADVVRARFGRLDSLVNNAGIAGAVADQVPGATDLDVVRAVFATNVLGVITTTEAMLPLLRASGAPRIVNVSSSVGSLARMTDPDHYFTGLRGSLAYAPSKAALNQVTVQYAKQLRPEGVLVNAADPGPCATDFTAGFPGVTRTAADGAAVAVRLATLPTDGPTGGFFAAAGPVPW